MIVPTHVCVRECYHYRLYQPGQTVAFREDANVPEHFRKLTPEEQAYMAGSEVTMAPQIAPQMAAPIDPGLMTQSATQAVASPQPMVGMQGIMPAMAPTTSPIPESEVPLAASAPPLTTPTGNEAPKTAKK